MSTATYQGHRLYKKPNRWNDWSDVTEVYVKGLIRGYIKLHYHGRMIRNNKIAILETEGGCLCTYPITDLRFKR